MSRRVIPAAFLLPENERSVQKTFVKENTTER